MDHCCQSILLKWPIFDITYDIILIEVITYDRILVIETAVTLFLYLNLCAYRVQCLSTT